MRKDGAGRWLRGLWSGWDGMTAGMLFDRCGQVKLTRCRCRSEVAALLAGQRDGDYRGAGTGCWGPVLLRASFCFA